jgi:sulfonate transport system substrate-binding protein
MPTHALIPVLAGAAALALTLTGCAQAGSSAGGNGSTSSVVLNAGQLGQSKITEALLEASGESDDLDYDVAWNLFDAGPAFIEAVPSGSVDVAMMADTPPIFAQVSQSPVKIVSVATSTPADESQVEIVVPADSDIQSVDDLIGKKVSVVQGTILQYTVARVLEDAGHAYGDIEAINLAPVDAAAALQQGSIDAAALLDPTLTNLVASGARVVADGAGLVPDYVITVATDTALADEGKAAAIEDFIARVQRAYDWAEENPDEWSAVYAQTTGLEPAAAAAVVARQEYSLLPIDSTVIANQQAQADYYFELGLLPEKLDVSEEFDDRFSSIAEGN